MTFAIHRSGGTNAGRRRLIHSAHKPWTCKCLQQACVDPCDDACLSCIETRKTNDPRLTRCPDCGTKRP